MAEYRVSAGAGMQRFRGVVLGGEGVLQRGSRLSLTLVAQGGVLTTDAAGEPDRTLGEIAADARVFVAPWLALHGGAGVRAHATDVARQRWVLVRAGAEGRLRFSGHVLCGVVRWGVLPVVSVSGLESPNLAVAAAAGMEYQRGRLRGEVTYAVERFDFPPVGAVTRLEQLSTLTIRAGLRLRAAP